MIKKLPNYTNLEKLFKSFNIDPMAINIMKDKKAKNLFLIKDLKTPAGNILKQEALSIGAELATPPETIICGKPSIDCVLMCSDKELKNLIKKLKVQPFGLKQISKELKKYLKINRFPLEIMGVLNINEDSFYKQSRAGDDVLERSLKMIEDGANIIDIGGLSSRPGSVAISQEEELLRVKPIIDILYSNKIHKKITLSIDSYRPKVIEYALQNGFTIVNDITGLKDDEVCRIVSKYGTRVCIMHKKGTPKTMQEDPQYKDVVLDVKDFFKQQIEKAKKFGIKDLILDVGIGFGKTLDHNIELINLQEDFLSLGYPLLIGASRKSMIDNIIPTKVEDRLSGTLAIHIQAVINGASIIRCHDVKEHFQALKVLETLRDRI
jgi:dihydropteroate synthase